MPGRSGSGSISARRGSSPPSRKTVTVSTQVPCNSRGRTAAVSACSEGASAPSCSGARSRSSRARARERASACAFRTRRRAVDKIRVLIADDHTLVREGLHALLEGHGGFEVIAEASTGREAVDRALQLRPDVVVMDIGMPVLDGLEATRRLVRANSAIRVLVLTVHETEDYFFRVLEAGAHGFLVKDAASTELVAAVPAVPHP